MPCRYLIWSLILPLVSCVHAPTPVADGVPPTTSVDYALIINRNTSRTNQYAGFYQTFQADMTILNTEVQTAGLRQRGYFMQWDNKQLSAEREKMLQDSSSRAKFFLRFYSPENDYDDLHKGKTIWKVFLDYSGQRFEGKVRKMTDKFVEIQTLFPHFDRFSSPYEITFNVPMTTVEEKDCKVTLTSSLGTAEFSFSAKK